MPFHIVNKKKDKNMNYLDEFEFELNEAKNICHVYTDKLRHNPKDVENIYHVCGDSLRYKLIDTICLIESPQADEDDVWDISLLSLLRKPHIAS
jgi:hypothetical protein